MTRNEKLFLIFSYVLMAGTALSTLWWPMGRDQGIFAVVADTILAGGTPYIDAWEVKGPLVYYLSALAQWVFGPNQWGIRALDLFFLCIAMVFLWRILRQITDAFTANVGVLVYVSNYYGYCSFWSTSQPDEWVGMLFLISFYMILMDKGRSNTALFIHGMIIAIATQIKLPYIVFLLPVGLYYLVTSGGNYRMIAVRMASFLGGFVVVISLTIAWLYHLGALGEFIEMQFGFNPSIYVFMHKRPLYMVPVYLLKFLVKTNGIFILVFIGTLLWGGQSKRFRNFIYLFFAVAILIVIIQNKFYPYHWIVAFGPMVIIFSVGFKRLIEYKLPQGGTRYLKAIAMSMVVIIVLLNAMNMRLHNNVQAMVDKPFWERQSDTYLGTFINGDFSSLAITRTGEYLKEHTGTNDKVLVWGLDPLVNYISRTLPPTRFIFNYPLVLSKGTKYYAPYRQEFLQSMSQDRPKFIVIVDNDTNNLMKKTSVENLKEFKEFEDFIKEHYMFEKIIEDYEIWRLKSL